MYTITQPEELNSLVNVTLVLNLQLNLKSSVPKQQTTFLYFYVITTHLMIGVILIHLCHQYTSHDRCNTDPFYVITTHLMIGVILIHFLEIYYTNKRNSFPRLYTVFKIVWSVYQIIIYAKLVLFFQVLTAKQHCTTKLIIFSSYYHYLHYKLNLLHQIKIIYILCSV